MLAPFALAAGLGLVAAPMHAQQDQFLPIGLVARVEASSHPMQYFLSLPPGWKAGRRYPVLVAIDGTQSAWQPAAAMFARVRDELGLDFIIVVPIVTTNVGGDPRNVNKYWYADSVWDRFARDGRCTFDFDGLKAVSEDVYLRYGGERKIYMTGFSAGGHLTWATVFRHPDWLDGAAISSGNFNGRCVTAGMTAGDGDPYSDDPSREKLPVKVIDGERDPIFATGQGTNAVSIAERKGYRNVSRETIMAHGHEPYNRQVLTFFALLRARSAVHRDTTP